MFIEHLAQTHRGRALENVVASNGTNEDRHLIGRRGAGQLNDNEVVEALVNLAAEGLIGTTESKESAEGDVLEDALDDVGVGVVVDLSGFTAAAGAGGLVYCRVSESTMRVCS